MFPDTDPYSVRFTDLHKWVVQLPNFVGDPAKSNEGILEAIQTAWRGVRRRQERLARDRQSAAAGHTRRRICAGSIEPLTHSMSPAVAAHTTLAAEIVIHPAGGSTRRAEISSQISWPRTRRPPPAAHAPVHRTPAPGSPAACDAAAPRGSPSAPIFQCPRQPRGPPGRARETSRRTSAPKAQ